MLVCGFLFCIDAAWMTVTGFQTVLKQRGLYCKLGMQSSDSCTCDCNFAHRRCGRIAFTIVPSAGTHCILGAYAKRGAPRDLERARAVACRRILKYCQIICRFIDKRAEQALIYLLRHGRHDSG